MLPIKYERQYRKELEEIAGQMSGLAKRTRALHNKLTSVNLATILVTDFAGNDSWACYGDVLEAWQKEIDAPEEDFRAELNAAMRNGYISMSITAPSRINEDTRIYITERLGDLLALEA